MLLFDQPEERRRMSYVYIGIYISLSVITTSSMPLTISSRHGSFCGKGRKRQAGSTLGRPTNNTTSRKADNKKQKCLVSEAIPTTVTKPARFWCLALQRSGWAFLPLPPPSPPPFFFPQPRDQRQRPEGGQRQKTRLLPLRETGRKDGVGRGTMPARREMRHEGSGNGYAAPLSRPPVHSSEAA